MWVAEMTCSIAPLGLPLAPGGTACYTPKLAWWHAKSMGLAHRRQRRLLHIDLGAVCRSACGIVGASKCNSPAPTAHSTNLLHAVLGCLSASVSRWRAY